MKHAHRFRSYAVDYFVARETLRLNRAEARRLVKDGNPFAAAIVSRTADEHARMLRITLHAARGAMMEGAK
jgi:hypothetical protein